MAFSSTTHWHGGSHSPRATEISSSSGICKRTAKPGFTLLSQPFPGCLSHSGPHGKMGPFIKQTTGEDIAAGDRNLPSKVIRSSSEVHSPEYQRAIRGEVRERPNRRDWKSRVPAMVPWVRTPPSPPYWICRERIAFKRRMSTPVHHSGP